MSLTFLRTGETLFEGTPRASRRHTRPTLDIAFVNNMPDAALRSTERQFSSLIEGAAGSVAVRLHLYALPGISRGEEARDYLAARYGAFDDLLRTSFDAAIVTGNEPRAARLDAEPYWPELARLIDWAETHTATSLWSCLAAHAAVLHLSGIERRPLPEKLSGIYEGGVVGSDPLLAGIGRRIAVPHSRWNALRAGDLREGGYSLISESAEAGVDLFTLTRRSKFVFMQGHPEYDTDTLMREYRRDVGRFLASDMAAYPREPANYFSHEAAAILRAFRRRAETHRNPALFAVFPNVATPCAIANRWQPSARRFYRNWLDEIVALKGLTAAGA